MIAVIEQTQNARFYRLPWGIFKFKKNSPSAFAGVRDVKMGLFPVFLLIRIEFIYDFLEHLDKLWGYAIVILKVPKNKGRRDVMKFFIPVSGRLEERAHCDNSSCPNYTGRMGLSPIKVISVDGKDFCSGWCHEHYPEAEEFDRRVLAGKQSLILGVR